MTNRGVLLPGSIPSLLLQSRDCIRNEPREVKGRKAQAETSLLSQTFLSLPLPFLNPTEIRRKYRCLWASLPQAWQQSGILQWPGAVGCSCPRLPAGAPPDRVLTAPSAGTGQMEPSQLHSTRGNTGGGAGTALERWERSREIEPAGTWGMSLHFLRSMKSHQSWSLPSAACGKCLCFT